MGTELAISLVDGIQDQTHGLADEAEGDWGQAGPLIGTRSRGV